MPVDSDLVRSLMECEFMEMIPQDVRDLVADVRTTFFAFKAEVQKGSAERGTDPFLQDDAAVFDDYYHRPGKESAYDKLSDEKQLLMVQLKMELVGMMPYEWDKKQSKQQRRKENRKKFKYQKKKKSKKRGGGKKKNGEEEHGINGDESLFSHYKEVDNDDDNKDDDYDDDDNDSPYKNMTVKEITQKISKLGPGHEDDFDIGSKEEWTYRRFHNLPYMPWEIDIKCRESKERMEKAKEAQKNIMKENGIIDPRTPEELEKEKAIVDECTRDLARTLENFEDALANLIMHPLFESRDALCDHFSGKIGKLTDSNELNNYARVKGIVDLFSQPGGNFISRLRETKLSERDDSDFSFHLQKQRDKVKFELPSASDPEHFAKLLNQLLQEENRENDVQVYDMAEMLHTEKHDFNILKQKVVEHCFPYLLKVMKDRKVCFELYIAELIFKLAMGLPVARKYCWRDTDYFPMLSALLITTDHSPNMDPNQIRGDAAHILYVSMLAASRDVYIQIRDANILERFVPILREDPTNYRDAQTGEDIILSITMMTDHWDIFESLMRDLDVNRWVKKWRKFALKYSTFLERFSWNVEFLLIRLKVLLCSDEIKRRKPSFRLQESQVVADGRDFIRSYNRTICSNPSCYKRSEEGNDRFKKCSKCSLSYYCCKKCQLEHWTTHKKWCKRPIWDKKVGIDKLSVLNTIAIRKHANHTAQETASVCLVQNFIIDIDDVE